MDQNVGEFFFNATGAYKRYNPFHGSRKELENHKRRGRSSVLITNNVAKKR